MTGEALPCSTEVGCGGYGRWKERGRDERERVEHGGVRYRTEKKVYLFTFMSIGARLCTTYRSKLQK
jgi:hypothetical protein